jgi:hypothetical protein
MAAAHPAPTPADHRTETAMTDAEPPSDRRRFLRTAGLAAAAAALPSGAPAAAGPRLALDLSRPEDNLTAWMKIRASAETQDVYLWFTGTLDLAVPGQPIRPIVALDTILLRRVQRLGPHRYHATDWEASVYRDWRTGEVADEVENPVTGRRVRPLHYREGPVTFEYAADRQPRLVGLPTPFEERDEPFRQPYRIVGDDIWMTKEMYIFGREQWLDAREFPEETPATPLNVSSIATMKARLSDVLDPAQAAVPCEYFYQATSDPLPWMLMGRTPGFVVWHEAGRKFLSLDQAPAATLAAVEKIHPQWFARPVPWEGFVNMFSMYREQRGR